jgi:hypothetical protein
MRSLLAAAFVSVVLLACPRSSGSTVMGSDDEQMDRDSAQLEELRSRGDVTCADACAVKARACDVSKSTCAIAAKAPERDDFQKKCVMAQEDCASFSEKCAGCAN